MTDGKEVARFQPGQESANVFDAAGIIGVPIADAYFSTTDTEVPAALMTANPTQDLLLPPGMILTSESSRLAAPEETERNSVPRVIGYVRTNRTVHIFGPADMRTDGKISAVPRVVRNRLNALNVGVGQDYAVRPTSELTGGRPLKILRGDEAEAIVTAQQQEGLIKRAAHDIPAALAALMLLGESDNSEFAQELAARQLLILQGLGRQGLLGRVQDNQK